jgi:putative transmembrane protein
MDKNLLDIIFQFIVPALGVIIIFLLYHYKEVKSKNKGKSLSHGEGNINEISGHKSDAEDNTAQSKGNHNNQSVGSAEKPISDEEYHKKIHDEQRELLLKTLKELGCQPEDEEERIYLKYQGVNFSIIQNHKFIRIWDLPYSETNLLDINLPIIVEAMGKANSGFGPTVVMTEADEKGYRHLASRMDILFIPEIPNPKNYLTLIFDSFFKTRDVLKREISELINPPANERTKQKQNPFPWQN